MKKTGREELIEMLQKFVFVHHRAQNVIKMSEFSWCQICLIMPFQAYVLPGVPSATMRMKFILAEVMYRLYKRVELQKYLHEIQNHDKQVF